MRTPLHAGFHHADLRLANVMEIMLPDSRPHQATATERSLQERCAPACVLAACPAAWLDQFGMCACNEDLSGHAGAQARVGGWCRRTLERDRGLQAAPDRCMYQFKIIDYGLANFDETYACGPDLSADEVWKPAAPDIQNCRPFAAIAATSDRLAPSPCQARAPLLETLCFRK